MARRAAALLPDDPISFAAVGVAQRANGHLDEAIAALERAPLPEGLSPEMREMQFEALRGTLRDLEAELADYDALHDATLIEATGIGEFPTALIRARIARGLLVIDASSV